MSMALALPGLVLLVAGGAWMAAVLDRLVPAFLAGQPAGNVLAAPLRSAAALVLQQRLSTERPDALNWLLAPAAYLALAVIAISVVPLSADLVAADFDAGIVLWGACESLTVVVIFLHGWSANAPFPLIGGYRYAAIGLSVMLLSMFVLIAAALPAESLAVSDIVESQRAVWNVIRQPLGLPLFLILGLTLTLRGPMDYADAWDLAGGTSAESSGTRRAAWQCARLAMLVSVASMASAIFLGGYLGPVLPGPLWMILKVAAVITVLVVLENLFARQPPSRMLSFLWLVLLPVSFVNLVIVGIEVLLWP